MNAFTKGISKLFKKLIMKSRSKMLFYCSLLTIEKIFEENSFATHLCETRIQRILSWKPDFEIIESDGDSVNVEYITKGSGGAACQLNFYKVSDSIVKCQVETNFGWTVWITVILISFLVGFFVKSDMAIGAGIFAIMLMMFFAFFYYYGINSLCSRIKRNYEKNELFLKLYDHLLKEASFPTLKSS